MSQGAYIIRELKQRGRGRQRERHNMFMMCFFTKIQIRNFTSKTVFRFFTKIPEQIIDANNAQRRCILFFGSYPKLDTLSDTFHPKGSFKLRIRKECILPAVMQNNLNTRYISSLTTLLIFTAIFKTKARIKRFILSIYRVVKSQYKRDLHCSSSDHKDKTATQLRCGVLQDFTFPLHISLQDSSSFRPFKAISLCSSHRIQ